MRIFGIIIYQLVFLGGGNMLDLSRTHNKFSNYTDQSHPYIRSLAITTDVILKIKVENDPKFLCNHKGRVNFFLILPNKWRSCAHVNRIMIVTFTPRSGTCRKTKGGWSQSKANSSINDLVCKDKRWIVVCHFTWTFGEVFILLTGLHILIQLRIKCFSSTVSLETRVGLIYFMIIVSSLSFSNDTISVYFSGLDYYRW